MENELFCALYGIVMEEAKLYSRRKVRVCLSPNSSHRRVQSHPRGLEIRVNLQRLLK